MSVPADELLLLNVERDEGLFDPSINIIQGDIIVPNFQDNMFEKQANSSRFNKKFALFLIILG